MTEKIVPLPAIQIPVIDRGTGLCDTRWYRYFEQMRERTGGDVDQVDANTNDIEDKADKTTAINAGNGLDGGGTLGANITIDGKKNTGWTGSTGTPNKGVYATYAGHTASAGYVQAEAQATDDAVKAASQRIKAIEDALRANEAIN